MKSDTWYPPYDLSRTPSLLDPLWLLASVIAARYNCSDWGNSGRDADIANRSSLTPNGPASRYVNVLIGSETNSVRIGGRLGVRPKRVPHAGVTCHFLATFTGSLTA